MHRRCRPDWHGHASYADRGIKVCDRWGTFENFLADMGQHPGPGFSLDRIDNSGNYQPSNCRWATATQQQNNTRMNNLLTVGSETFSISEWARRAGIAECSLRYRLKTGWTPELAVTLPKTPPHKRCRAAKLERQGESA